jgi:hypothetical protein
LPRLLPIPFPSGAKDNSLKTSSKPKDTFEEAAEAAEAAAIDSSKVQDLKDKTFAHKVEIHNLGLKVDNAERAAIEWDDKKQKTPIRF